MVMMAVLFAGQNEPNVAWQGELTDGALDIAF